jgi:hypothetical protein
MDEVEFARLNEPIALVVDDEPLILMDTADIRPPDILTASI